MSYREICVWPKRKSTCLRGALNAQKLNARLSNEGQWDSGEHNLKAYVSNGLQYLRLKEQNFNVLHV